MKILQQGKVINCSEAMEGGESPVSPGQCRSPLVDSEDTHDTRGGRDAHSAPIGFLRSCFKSKNGTPRQPSVCGFSRAKLTVLKEVFPNPEHSIQGLGEFSHIWILFVFHKNGDRNFTKAKVKPPRLDGAKVGVFASRSPYRPNPIGLTLAKLDRIEGCTLHLSGVDIIDGTPVLDIKPYVPSYDNPDYIQHSQSSSANSGCLPCTSAPSPWERLSTDSQGDTTEALPEEETEASGRNASASGRRSTTNPEPAVPKTPNHGNGQNASTETSASPYSEAQGSKVGIANWIHSPPIKMLDVRFTAHAEAELEKFKTESSDPDFRLEFLRDQQEVRQAIGQVLEADPRSTYRRNRCRDRLYFFTVDTIHVTCWFGGDFVEVVRVQPLSHANLP